jgi:endonuclease/exonuclease/phosphatase (EEP) superfamily protein YafD
MIRRPVTVLLAVLTALASVPTLVRLLGDGQRIPLVLLVTVLPYAFVPLVVLLAVQFALGRRRIAAVTAAVVLLDLVWFVPLFVSDDAGKGTPLTVMTSNLRYGEADPFALVKLVKEHHVDVLATEELTEAAVNDLRGAGLAEELPYFTGETGRGPDGCGLWSRYPISAESSWTLRFRAPGAVVKAPSGDVLVRVVHAYPPVGDEKGVYARDTEDVLRNVAALPTTRPTIVLGDFNATLDNSFLRDLMGDRFRDAGEKAGAGLVRTWGVHPGSTRLLDLDHVFVDARIGVRSTSVLEVPRSDHDALLARLVVG